MVYKRPSNAAAENVIIENIYYELAVAAPFSNLISGLAGVSKFKAVCLFFCSSSNNCLYHFRLCFDFVCKYN